MVINQAVKATSLLLLFSIIIGCMRSTETEDSFRQAALMFAAFNGHT